MYFLSSLLPLPHAQLQYYFAFQGIPGLFGVYVGARLKVMAQWFLFFLI